MANMAHVGPGETFSWPPPGQTAPPHAPRSPGGPGANPVQETGAVPGAGDPSGSLAPLLGGFFASRYRRVEAAHHPPLPDPGPRLLGLCSTRWWVCSGSLFLRRQLPY